MLYSKTSILTQFIYLCRYDARLMSSIRNVARTDSRSMFHIPNTAAYSYSTTDNTIPDSTRQFGVSLNKLKKDKSEDSLPLVIKKCTEYIENNGLEVTGIFRRAPNNAKIHAIKRRFDLGAVGYDVIRQCVCRALVGVLGHVIWISEGSCPSIIWSALLETFYV